MTSARKKAPERSLYGIVVKVENLDLCRVFYRDILELGPPISDSNFWVEFRLQKDVSLVLELVAKTAFGSTILDPRLAPLDRPVQEKHFRRKHGPDAYYGQKKEKDND